MQTSSTNTDVLIAGAGPTGLVLALWLTRCGVRVRIIDKTPEPGTTSRAIGVQARTLELYRQIGLADDVVARGRRATTSSARPICRYSSSVRAWTPMARDVVPGSGVLSMILTRTPHRVSQRASTRPVGPAPAIRTSV